MTGIIEVNKSYLQKTYLKMLSKNKKSFPILFDVCMEKISNKEITLNKSLIYLDPENKLTPATWREKRRNWKTQNTTYNQEHIAKKYQLNYIFWNLMNFDKNTTVADLYAGEHSVWRPFSNNVISNDSDKKFIKNHDYCNSAHVAIKKMKKKGYTSFDLVDVDPMGSSMDVLKQSIELANKALIITLGEVAKNYKTRFHCNNHKRFKEFYGIELDSLEDETQTKQLMEIIIQMGLEKGKVLTPLFVAEWSLISRIYFKVN